MRTHGVPPRRGQARGRSHHLPVPRLALRRALRAVPGCARTQDRHLCHQGRGRQGPRAAEGGVTMTDEVFVYALRTCPWCRKTKQWFTDSLSLIHISEPTRLGMISYAVFCLKKKKKKKQ